MDNASKALIMAGAILIAVALVSLGVYLYQSAADKVRNGSNEIEVTQILAKNSEIEKFEGTIKGSEAKQLVRLIVTNNAKHAYPADITIDGCTSGDTSVFTDNAKYVVTITYGDDRYISKVNIEKK